MEIRVFPSNADLPDHLRWQIISVIRMQWYQTAGDYKGPSALPEEWHPCHMVGTEGDAVNRVPDRQPGGADPPPRLPDDALRLGQRAASSL